MTAQPCNRSVLCRGRAVCRVMEKLGFIGIEFWYSGADATCKEFINNEKPMGFQ